MTQEDRELTSLKIDMTRKDEIKQKAQELSQIAFPDEHNIWARPNFEAKVVNSCCISMAEWADKTMFNKVYDFIIANVYKYGKVKFVDNRASFDFRTNTFLNDLKQAMEE